MKGLLEQSLHCLKCAQGWLLAQLLLTPVLLALAVVWLRIPDAETWQFVFWVALGLALLALFLGMQAGLLRALVGGERKTHFLFAVLWFFCAGVMAWIACNTATHYEDQIGLAAGYLNSRLPAGRVRAAWLTREHLAALFSWAEWLVLWVGIPGLLIPIAAIVSVDGVKPPEIASLNILAKKLWWLVLSAICLFVFLAFWIHLPALILFAALGLLAIDWKSIRSVWMNWRWWPVVLPCAYAWTHWMLRAFNGQPHGTPRAQELAVLWKSALAYVIGNLCWLLPMIWAAVLLGHRNNNPQPPELTGAPVLAGGPLRHQAGAKAEV